MAKKQVQQEPVLIKERKRRVFFALPWSFTTYAITTKNLIYKKGLLSTYEEEILLYRVQDISVKRTLGQKLFGLGSIEVHSQDKTCPVLEIKNIAVSPDSHGQGLGRKLIDYLADRYRTYFLTRHYIF